LWGEGDVQAAKGAHAEARLGWRAEFSPHPGLRTEEALADCRLAEPGSVKQVSCGHGHSGELWALLISAGTLPAAWLCPGPRGSGRSWPQAREGKRAIKSLIKGSQLLEEWREAG
jgi:hypothetical protein